MLEDFKRNVQGNVKRNVCFSSEKQLDKDEFQEDGSMAAFWVVNNQFHKFIDSKFTLDYDSQMRDKYFVEYTRIKVKHFRDTLLQHMGQQHTEQPEIINKGRVDQYTEQCQVKSPMLDSSFDNPTLNNVTYSMHKRLTLTPHTGSNVDIPNIHECKQTLDVSAGTSINVQKEQSLDLSASTLCNVNKENLRVWLLKKLISQYQRDPQCDSLNDELQWRQSRSSSSVPRLQCSTTNQRTSKKPWLDSAWIESMQKNLHQFDRLDYVELFDRPPKGYAQKKEMISKMSFELVALAW
ncbi:hypothetical protein Tco_0587667 [Tanacetum coccineum]